jgi:hypothetical protein
MKQNEKGRLTSLSRVATTNLAAALWLTMASKTLRRRNLVIVFDLGVCESCLELVSSNNSEQGLCDA